MKLILYLLGCAVSSVLFIACCNTTDIRPSYIIKDGDTILLDSKIKSTIDRCPKINNIIIVHK